MWNSLKHRDTGRFLAIAKWPHQHLHLSCSFMLVEAYWPKAVEAEWLQSTFSVETEARRLKSSIRTLVHCCAWVTTCQKACILCHPAQPLCHTAFCCTAQPDWPRSTSRGLELDDGCLATVYDEDFNKWARCFGRGKSGNVYYRLTLQLQVVGGVKTKALVNGAHDCVAGFLPPSGMLS